MASETRFMVRHRKVFEDDVHVANIVGYREVWRGAVTPGSGYRVLAVGLTHPTVMGSYAYYVDARRAALAGCIERAS